MNERFIQVVRNSQFSQYRLAKDSGVPFSTINGLMLGRQQINNCAAFTVYTLARCLNVDISELLDFSISTTGIYQSIKYEWMDTYTGKNLCFQYNQIPVTIKTDLQPCLPSEQQYLPIFASWLIDDYIQEQQFQRGVYAK